MVDKTATFASVYFWAFLVVAYALYAVAIFMNINTLRKIHGAYMKGFYFQKQCRDEYTEYESLRRHGYEALKNERPALDNGSFLFLLILFWTPMMLTFLLMGYMLGLPTNTIWLYVLILAGSFIVMMLINLLTKTTYRDNFYQFFKGSYCNTLTPNAPRYVFYQGILLMFTAVLFYSFYSLHSRVDNGTTTVYLKNFLDPKANPGAVTSLANAIYQKADQNLVMVYLFGAIWVFVAYWVNRSNKQYMRMRSDVLCHYEGLMEDYRDALMNYIYPVPDPKIYPTREAYDRETEVRFKRIKDHVERNYLRIHGTMPSPTITEDSDTIGDYAIYLMNWRGREFEDVPESPELNALRDFMFRLRTDKVYKNAFEGYFKFNKWYLWVHLVVIVYAIFHILYTSSATFEKWMTLLIAIAIIGGVFLLSWYAWFDIALRV